MGNEALRIARDAFDEVLVLLDAIRSLTNDLENPTPHRLADIAYERVSAAYDSLPQLEPSHG